VPTVRGWGEVLRTARHSVPAAGHSSLNRTFDTDSARDFGCDLRKYTARHSRNRKWQMADGGWQMRIMQAHREFTQAGKIFMDSSIVTQRPHRVRART